MPVTRDNSGHVQEKGSGGHSTPDIPPDARGGSHPGDTSDRWALVFFPLALTGRFLPTPSRRRADNASMPVWLPSAGCIPRRTGMPCEMVWHFIFAGCGLSCIPGQWTRPALMSDLAPTLKQLSALSQETRLLAFRALMEAGTAGLAGRCRCPTAAACPQHAVGAPSNPRQFRARQR